MLRGLFPECDPGRSSDSNEPARYDGILYGVPDPEVLLSPLTTQEAVLSSRIEGTFFDHQSPLLSYSLAQSPQGSHGVGDCSRNRNPEHHADPRLPSLRMVKLHDDGEARDARRCENSGIQSFNQEL